MTSDSEEHNQICRVVVHRAKHLIAKGTDGSGSNAFVKMSCGKEHYMTSIADKTPNPTWNEDCEFNVSKDDPCVEFLVCHRGKLLDDFLGMVTIPVSRRQGYQSTSPKWYKLHQKANKTKKETKDRGEIEISVEVIDDSLEYLSVTGDCEGSEIRGQISKAKRSASLPAKIPGLKSKSNVSRLRSYISVHRERSTSPELVGGREKSDSNDSGKASDSLASESPSSVRRMTSHNTSENFGSQESIESHGKDKKKGLKKRMKSAIVSLKRDKNHHKESSDTYSPYSSTSSLTSPPTDDTHPPSPRNPHPNPSTPSDDSSWQPPPIILNDIRRRNRGASTSDLHTPEPKVARPLSYPLRLRSISENHIPLQALYTHGSLKEGAGPGEELKSGGNLGSDSEQCSSQDNIKLRHSFRSGLPSLRKSNVSVTFDQLAVNAYGTKAEEVKTDEELPSQYVNMTKEALIRRLLLKEQIVREKQKYIKELEYYTDNLLLKVMLESPRLLERDFKPGNRRY